MKIFFISRGKRYHITVICFVWIIMLYYLWSYLLYKVSFFLHEDKLSSSCNLTDYIKTRGGSERYAHINTSLFQFHCFELHCLCQFNFTKEAIYTNCLAGKLYVLLCWMHTHGILKCIVYAWYHRCLNVVAHWYSIRVVSLVGHERVAVTPWWEDHRIGWCRSVAIVKLWLLEAAWWWCDALLGWCDHRRWFSQNVVNAERCRSMLLYVAARA